LTDVMDNRSLIAGTLVLDVIALGAVAIATNLPLFLVACFVAGVAASAVQMLVPAAAAMTPESQRGQVIGKVMSGLMIGILLSRPIASITAEIAGWRWFYGALALVTAVLALIIFRLMPKQPPKGAVTYPRLIGSMWTLLCDEPVLRHRALSQGLCMAAFSMFWTTVALLLGKEPFNLGNTGIALFALTGAGGAIIAPVAGRAGDRGLDCSATLLAQAVVVGALALAWFAGGAACSHPRMSLVTLSFAGLLFDMGVIGEQTLGRRAINMIRPEARGRVNGLFTGIFFLGASLGASLSGLAWTRGGWTAVCAGGVLFGVVALALTMRGSLTRLRP
jgi:predicted MFS family arabinose efflux permease